jgi:excisionase family DNA binding protein
MSDLARVPALYSVDEVCERLRMSRPTFYRKYADGTAPQTTRYGRRIFVTSTALEDYLTQHVEEPGQ